MANKKIGILYTYGIALDEIDQICNQLTDVIDDETFTKYFGNNYSERRTKVKQSEKSNRNIVPYHSLGYYQSIPITKKEIKSAYKKLPQEFQALIDKNKIGGFIDNEGRQYIKVSDNLSDLQDNYEIRLPITHSKKELGLDFPELKSVFTLYGKNSVWSAYVTKYVQKQTATCIAELYLFEVRELNSEDIEKIEQLRVKPHYKNRK